MNAQNSAMSTNYEEPVVQEQPKPTSLMEMFLGENLDEYEASKMVDALNFIGVYSIEGLNLVDEEALNEITMHEVDMKLLADIVKKNAPRPPEVGGGKRKRKYKKHKSKKRRKSKSKKRRKSKSKKYKIKTRRKRR